MFCNFSCSKCEGCGKEINFSKEASMSCKVHKKDYCFDCTDLRKACPNDGEPWRYIGIINPEWIVNLLVNEVKNESKNSNSSL